MGFFKCMGFKANFDLPRKEKPPQVVCLKYIVHSEFDDLSKPLPSTNNNISIKPIKIKPVAPKPEIQSIFNIPSEPLAEFEPKQESAQPVEPPKSILKGTKSNEDSQVEVSETTQEPDNSMSPLITYSAESEFETNDNQVELPPSEKDVTLLFANEQEISTIFSTEQELEDVLATFPTEEAQVLASFPTEQEEVPPSFSTEQEEVPPSFSTEQEEVPPSFSTEQREVSPSFSTEQEEVPPSHTNEQVEILSKEEEEGIISSEDDTPHNSPYQVRYAKKPIPNYEPKLNDESEISDYESEDDDVDLADANNNQDGYSSQAASIFFAGVEAEPTPRLKQLPKEDDEV